MDTTAPRVASALSPVIVMSATTIVASATGTSAATSPNW